MGGYVAACALRAAGASGEHPRPAAFSCHYLGAARFGAVDVLVETRKRGRTAGSQRVEVTQDGRPILDAMVWSVGDEVEGLEHDDTVPPAVPGPDDLAGLDELLPQDAKRPYPFWNNLDAKPINFESTLAAARLTTPALAGMAALHAQGHVRRSVGGGGPLSHPRRPAQLAIGTPPPCVAGTTVHRADAGPERRLPPPPHGGGLAALRRGGAPVDRRTLRMDGPGVVPGRECCTPPAEASVSTDASRSRREIERFLPGPVDDDGWATSLSQVDIPPT